MLNGDERDYLFRMAGEAPPQPVRPSREITPGIRHLLDGMPSTPAYVVDAAYNVLAWNPLAAAFIGNLAGSRGPEDARRATRHAKRTPLSPDNSKKHRRAKDSGY
jgi:hypothetical protein